MSNKDTQPQIESEETKLEKYAHRSSTNAEEFPFIIQGVSAQIQVHHTIQDIYSM